MSQQRQAQEEEERRIRNNCVFIRCQAGCRCGWGQAGAEQHMDATVKGEDDAVQQGEEDRHREEVKEAEGRGEEVQYG